MKKWFLLALCFLLTGCAHQESAAPSLQNAPTVPVGGTAEQQKREDTLYPSVETLVSPDDVYTAEARTYRTYAEIFVRHHASGAEWQFTLPDGSHIPEYMFLPENWGEWLEANTLLVTVGRGGVAGGQHLYRCSLEMGGESLVAVSVLEQMGKILEADYDFTQDGQAEELERMTLLDPDMGEPLWHELWVRNGAGERIWGYVMAAGGPSWDTTLFALELDGKDCFLELVTGMGQGYCSYYYEVFALDETGEHQSIELGEVQFDVNFGSPTHGSFDCAAIAEFLWRVKELTTTADAILMDMDALDGLRCGVPAEVFAHGYHCGQFVDLDSRSAMETALENYAAEARYEALLNTTPVAPIEGEPVSPDGKYRLEAVGETDNYVSGVRPPEKLRLVDEEGNILWEDRGWLEQEICWSPDSRYAALYTAARTWGAITVIDTQTGWACDVKLPDGSSFGEYVFMDEMRWVEIDTAMYNLWFLLSDGEQTSEYRYSPVSDTTFSQSTTIMEGTYDFDRDGIGELVETDAVYLEYENKPSLYEVRLLENGESIWMEDAHTSHVGWNSVFACTLDGKDYLLRYNPYMSMGMGGYGYQLFYLDESGEAVTVRENSVVIDVNFGSHVFTDFNETAIAAFLRDIYSLLEQSTLLISTEDGEGWESISGTEFFWETDIFDLPEDSAKWEQHLADYETELTAARIGQ